MKCGDLKCGNKRKLTEWKSTTVKREWSPRTTCLVDFSGKIPAVEGH